MFLSSTTIPKLLDDTSAVALMHMIEKCETHLSLEIDVALFGMSLMEWFCGYLATSSKIKSFEPGKSHHKFIA